MSGDDRQRNRVGSSGRIAACYLRPSCWSKGSPSLEYARGCLRRNSDPPTGEAHPAKRQSPFSPPFSCALDCGDLGVRLAGTKRLARDHEGVDKKWSDLMNLTPATQSDWFITAYRYACQVHISPRAVEMQVPTLRMTSNSSTNGTMQNKRVSTRNEVCSISAINTSN